MPIPRGFTGALAVLALLSAGCERDGDDGGDGCRANLLPGDLVITEVMANPAGADDGKEWIEIYNATGSTLDLTGVELLAGKSDGTGDDRHVMRPVAIERGQYLVLGGMLEVARPDYVDYVYEGDISLRNSEGRLVLGCGGQVIDLMTYESAPDGASLGFDGEQVPDALANDDPADWCEAEQEYEDGAAGSPGARNEACEGDVPPTQCRDGASLRDIVAPLPGDLVINEFMANPSSTDGGKEWFEVYVGRDVDLNGLQLGKTVGDVAMTVNQADCLRATAGSYVLFAASDAAAANGGLPAVDVVIDFSLGNSTSGLFLALGGTVLDAIEYTSTGDGAATALDPTRRNTLDNDSEANWCRAEQPYGDGDKGTPGAANPSCGIVDPGNCIEGGDTQRPIVAPTEGSLVINEILANPSGTDTGKEWFEVYAAAEMDLNGLQIGKLVGAPEMTLPQGECIHVSGDSYLVFATSDNEEANGGLPKVDVLIDFTLNNKDSGIFLALDGLTLDAVSYTSPSGGAALALDPGKMNAADNDNADYWCAAAAAYGEGNLGTPGSENASCGIVEEGQCLDGGVARDQVAPGVGDLVINEFMANPKAVGDSDGEWFEVAVTRDVDLNGLELGRLVADGEDQTLPEGECLRAAADSFLLFARSTDAQTNGGLPAADVEIGFSLTNSDSGLFLGLDGAVLDAVTWTSVGDGASTALDPASLDATANDDPANWCPGTSGYGDGDRGTPRSANAACP